MQDWFPIAFLSGFISMGYLTLGLFFLKFWRRTRDGFFLMFALAFWLLAANEMAYPSTDAAVHYAWIYLMRLAAFLLIIIATVRKNMRVTRRE